MDTIQGYEIPPVNVKRRKKGTHLASRIRGHKRPGGREGEQEREDNAPRGGNAAREEGGGGSIRPPGEERDDACTKPGGHLGIGREEKREEISLQKEALGAYIADGKGENYNTCSR